MAEPTPARADLGRLLRLHRERLLWTQERLAEASGVSGRAISDIERGVHAGARLSTLSRLAAALALTDVETQQLLSFARNRTTVEPRPTGRRADTDFERASLAATIGAWDLAVAEYQDLVRDLDQHPGADAGEQCDALLGLGRSATLALRRHDARPAFVRAAQLAVGLGDRDRLVRAAAGYAFMTKAGDPVPDADETWRVGLLSIPDGDVEARATLSAARATTSVLANRVATALELATHALALARRSTSDDAMAVAISAYALASWGTPNAAERRLLAEEMQALEATTVDYVRLAGVELAAYPSLELGDVRAFEHCAAALREQAADLSHPYAVAQAEMWDATLALLRGDDAAAERLSASAVSLSGHAPNFTNGHLAQIFSIRLAQGRATELLHELAELASAQPTELAWRAAWVMVAAGADGHELDVRRTLERVRFEFWPLAQSWTLPVSAAFLIDACWRVDDVDLAGALAQRLTSHSGTCLVVTTATSCEGAVDHFLGLAAATRDDTDQARALLRRGLETHRRLASPHLVARSELALERVG